MITLAPAIIVHGFADARRAMAPGRPFTMLSAPGAARYAGCLWWQQLLAQSGFRGLSFLDCGAAPGRALEALKLGITGVILTGSPENFVLVGDIAAAQAALLLGQAPPALDLGKHGATATIETWLNG